MTGRIHSIQSLGTVDGPGIRFVVFLQGCPLRCGCCHNPDTWDFAGGEPIEASEIVTRAARYREYFGKTGGITLSGGEPLCQSAFATDVFARCHEVGISTCLDTSGCVLDEGAVALLAHTDRVLLDIKYTNDALYRAHVGCSMEAPLAFLDFLHAQAIPTTLRQVIIPTVNDSIDNVLALRAIADAYPCVDGIELLPFRKLCSVKYDQMGVPFPFAHLPEPTAEQMQRLNRFIS